MATQVLIAHTGQRLQVDTAQFSSLDDLKTWVARNSSVLLQHIVALTPQGRSAKFASLHAEREIYIYDIRVTQPSSSTTSSSLVSEVPLPKCPSVPAAPNSIVDAKSISAWQELYKERRSWAMRLAEDCQRMDAAAQARYDEMDVMIKCLDAAVANLEISVKQIEPKYTDLKNWVAPALIEHESLEQSWEQYLELAKNTSISPAMVKFMTRGQVTKSDPALHDLIELETARKAGKLAPVARRRFNEKAAGLDKAATQMSQGLERLIGDFDMLMNRSVLGHNSDTAQLLQDIEAIVNQIDSDYQTALGYGDSQRDLAQASKTASNHTERLVPSLQKRIAEMDEMLQYATKARNTIAVDSMGHMQTITDITVLHGAVRNQINVLNQSEDDMTTFDYLRLIHQLPYMYASFLVEAIRRRDWVDKVKMDSSTLANEMALFQDEESKRRKKWQKMVGSMYGPGLDTNVMGLEVNLLGEDIPWPMINKDELGEFLQTLQAQDTDQAILDDVSRLVQELDNPTRQQSKRLKAFKNGSVHEAALGRSGLLIRGDDELLRSLQDDKTKLESKLKTAESRVRRLEDLLHRQSQAARPGNLFQQQQQQQQQQNSLADVGASVRSNRLGDGRRPSDGADALLRKVTQLENELREEKQRSAGLQADLNTRTTEHDGMKDQIQEANSTKKDLLENMEAQKREFMDERKSLEDEIKSLKSRIEDTEDEIDHFGESRENEKASYDEKIQSFEAEIMRLTKKHNDDNLKTQGQVDFLRRETQSQQERLDASDRQVQISEEEKRFVSEKLRNAQESAQIQLESLRKLHGNIVAHGSISDDVTDLAEAILSHVSDLQAKLNNTESDALVVKTDLEKASQSVKELHAEVNDAKEKLSIEQTTSLQLREQVSGEKAKVKALESELADGRDQLNGLRGQLSDGESGSETLQKRLEAEEEKVLELTEEVASRQSHVGSLEEEVRMATEKLKTLQAKHSAQTGHHEERDEKTKELTQRLFSQNDRLTKLLERTGYSVKLGEDGMTITKVPRSERVAQNPNDSSDPGNSIRRSGTLGGRGMSESVDMELLYWMSKSDSVAETEKYKSFMQSVGSFNIDSFSDTIYHRIKDTEHKARKWQREARSYRDRAHTLQKDSHDKIAFKHFKEGDLALFLPTRNQQAGAWAAFNVGFPHYFLREQDVHRLRHREWLVARIARIQERVVDLSKSVQQNKEAESTNDEENDNPFQLSDGLRWYLIDAYEDKPGAPSTPGMGKSTVATNNVEATANIQSHAAKGKGSKRDSVNSIEGINKTLSKSLESRRSSSGSKKALPFQIGAGGTAFLKSSALASETNSLRAAAPETPIGTSPTQRGLLAPGDGNPIIIGDAESANGGPSLQADGAAADETGREEDQRPASGAEGQNTEPRIRIDREESAESTSKKSVLLDPLWTVDYSYESPGKK